MAAKVYIDLAKQLKENRMTKEKFIEKWFQYNPEGDLYNDVYLDLEYLEQQAIYDDAHGNYNSLEGMNDDKESL